MMRLTPPSLAEIRANLRLFAADWERAGFGMRYYVIAHLIAHGVMLGCSAASLAAMAAGEWMLQVGLLAAAAGGAVQALHCWRVLQQRYKVRYELI